MNIKYWFVTICFVGVGILLAGCGPTQEQLAAPTGDEVYAMCSAAELFVRSYDDVKRIVSSELVEARTVRVTFELQEVQDDAAIESTGVTVGTVSFDESDRWQVCVRLEEAAEGWEAQRVVPCP